MIDAQGISFINPGLFSASLAYVGKAMTGLQTAGDKCLFFFWLALKKESRRLGRDRGGAEREQALWCRVVDAPAPSLKQKPEHRSAKGFQDVRAREVGRVSTLCPAWNQSKY